MVTSLNPVPAIAAYSSDKVIYPLKEISTLDCRFNDFIDLSSNCKQNLPTLKTKDYKKYATQDGGYNDYTRIYTVLW
jgi:Leucine-rich repeat (LRR) protein